MEWKEDHTVYPEAAVYPPGELTRRDIACCDVLRFLLSTCTRDLALYGESYFLRSPESAGKVTPALEYLDCAVPVELRDAFDMLTTLGESGRTEKYAEGVGLPGGCKAAGTVQVHDLRVLVNDPYHFDAGGNKLSKLAKVFQTAITIPLKFHKEGHLPAKFIGVIVLYLEEELYHESSVLSYINSVQQLAQHAGAFSMERLRFTHGRKNRLHHNLQVMRIAIRFLMPMLSKFQQSAGKDIFEGVEAPKHTLVRRGTVQLKSETSALLESKKPNQTPWDTVRGFMTAFVNKLKGGDAKLPPEMAYVEVLYTFLGVFLFMTFYQLIIDTLNKHVTISGEKNLFAIPGSFGALSTLLFALSSAPLAQPWVVFWSHTLAMACSVFVIFASDGCQPAVQEGLSAGLTIARMAKFGWLHPPAGAIAVIFIQKRVAGSSDLQLSMLIISVYIGVALGTVIATLINNLSPKRKFPLYWWGSIPTTFLTAKEDIQTLVVSVKPKRNKDKEVAMNGEGFLPI